MTLSSASLGTGSVAKYLHDAADTASALSLSTTRVGIGKSNPDYTLDVLGTTNTVTRIENDDDTAYVSTASTTEYSSAQLMLSNGSDSSTDNHFVGIGFTVNSDTHASRAFFGAINPDEDADERFFNTVIFPYTFKVVRTDANDEARRNNVTSKLTVCIKRLVETDFHIWL